MWGTPVGVVGTEVGADGVGNGTTLQLSVRQLTPHLSLVHLRRVLVCPVQVLHVLQQHLQDRFQGSVGTSHGN